MGAPEGKDSPWVIAGLVLLAVVACAVAGVGWEWILAGRAW